jgi:hypothetical protein
MPQDLQPNLCVGVSTRILFSIFVEVWCVPSACARYFILVNWVRCSQNVNHELIGPSNGDNLELSLERCHAAKTKQKTIIMCGIYVGRGIPRKKIIQYLH